MQLASVRSWVPRVIGVAMILHGFANLASGIFPMFGSVVSEQVDEINRFTGLSDIQHASEMVSVLLGLILISLGFGLFKRTRMAWLWALIMQLIVFINSCLPNFNLETLITSLVFGAVLMLFRKEFYVRRTDAQGVDFTIAWFSVGFALLYGIAGSYLLRSQFRGIHNIVDAVYFTIVTYSTVGYGDITPITANAKMFTASMIIVGITSFVATLTFLIAPMIQQRVKGVFRIMNKMSSFNNHVVICGYNQLTRIAANQLVAAGTTCLFLEKDCVKAEQIRSDGYNVVTGDPSDSIQLLSSNLGMANTLICGHQDDGVNILILMAANEIKDKLKHELMLISRIEEPQNIDKAKKLGANEIISPDIIAGKMIAESAS